MDERLHDDANPFIVLIFINADFCVNGPWRRLKGSVSEGELLRHFLSWAASPLFCI